MQPVAGGKIAVPAGESARLEQGGLHLMCFKKLEDFTEGAELELTLQFESAGDIHRDDVPGQDVCPAGRASKAHPPRCVEDEDAGSGGEGRRDRAAIWTTGH